VGGVVMHPITQVQVLSWTEFGCLFLFLMKNHLVPPMLDLVFNNVSGRNKILSHDLFATIYHDQVSEKATPIYGDQGVFITIEENKLAYELAVTNNYSA
jgi:hypothetical protein